MLVQVPRPSRAKAIKLRPIHRALDAHADNFQIIIVCDGFKEAEKNDFEDLCSSLVTQFLRISPFDACKNHINVLAHFTVSPKDIIDGDNTAQTAFGFYIKDGIDTLGNPDLLNGLPVCTDVGKLREEISHLEFQHALCQFTGKKVWLNPLNRSYGAICVILKTSAFYRAVARTLPTEPLNYFTLCVENSKLGDQNRIEDWAGVFVHELAHSIHSYTEMSDGSMSSKKTWLGDEYAQLPMAYTYSEPLEPNLTAATTIQYDLSEVDIEHLKWRKLASAEELKNIKNKVSILESTEFDPGDYVIQDPLTYELTYEKSIDKIELVEGGMQYRSGIFHPNPVCRMRSWNLHHFCVVCKHHIIRAITGLHRTKPVLVNDVDIPFLMNSHKLRKRLIRSLTNHVRADGTTEQLTLASRCGIATGRMAKMLSQLGIPVDFLRVGIVQGHGFLLFRKVIIDPTFYQIYRDGNSYEYQYDNQGTVSVTAVPQGSEKATHPGVHFSNGFVGDFEQLLLHFQSYLPKTWPLWGGDDPDAKYSMLEGTARNSFDIPGYEIAKVASGWQLQIPKRETLPNLDQEVAADIEAELNRYEEYNVIKKNPPGRYQPGQWDAIKKMYDPLNLSIKLPKGS